MIWSSYSREISLVVDNWKISSVILRRLMIVGRSLDPIRRIGHTVITNNSSYVYHFTSLLHDDNNVQEGTYLL